MTLPVILHSESFSWALGVGVYQAVYEYLVDPFANLSMGPGHNGRGGRGAMQGTSGGQCGKIITAGATRGTHTAFTQGNVAQSSQIIDFREGTTTHVAVTTDASGHIVVKNGSGATLATSTQLYPINGHRSIECNVTVHDTTGAVELRVDTTEVWINVSGVDTRNGGTGVIDNVFLTSNSGRSHNDWVIHDGTGFLGDVIVDYFPANVAGTYTAGTASSGTLLSTIDDAPYNGSDFITEDNTSLPKKVSFGCGNAPANTATIFSVRPHCIMSKDDAGPDTGRLLLISGATEDDGGADASPLTVLCCPGARQLNLDPQSGGIAWTITNFNAIEVGWVRKT